VNDEFVVNPDHATRELSDIDLVVAATNDAIVMVEAGAKEVDESVMIDALELAHTECQTIIGMIEELVGLAGKPKMEFVAPEVDEELRTKVHGMAYNRLREGDSYTRET